MRRRPAALVTTVVGAYAMAHHLGRTAGTTGHERRAALPGDDLVPDARFVTDHAVTIDAPPASVWPWLVQMGWGRGGFYTARWVDRLLFPDNGPSADRIHPEWQDLAVGDRIADGAPETECFFDVEAIDPERSLVLLSRSHLPPTFRDRFGATIRWSWAFSLTDLTDGRTRLHVRTRARLGPRWLAAAYWFWLIPADLVMSRQMLDGLARRAEWTLPPH